MKYLLTAILLFPMLAGAQQSDVLFLNEGYFNFYAGTQEVPPSLGVLHSATSEYEELYIFDDAQFLSDGLIHEGSVYIAAQNHIVKLSAEDYSFESATEVIGLRDLAVAGNHLIASRGAYLATYDSYISIFDLADMGLEASLPADGISGPAFATEDIQVLDGIAYMCVSNSFEYGAYQSILGIYDLEEETYSQVDLGEDAVNPEHIMIYQDELYLFCNHNYDKSSIVKVNPGTLTTEAAYVANNASCALSALVNERIYFQEYGLETVARFNLEDFAVEDTLATPPYYAITQNPINGDIWASETDYVSSGTGIIMDAQGNTLESLPIGVSCGNILFHEVAANDVEEVHTDLNIFPNPSEGSVHVRWEEDIFSLRVYTLDGRLQYATEVRGGVDTIALPTGTYLLHLSTADMSLNRRVIIE